MRLPKINQKISLRIPKGSWEGLYATYVEAIDQQTITVAEPMYGGATIPLLKGEEVMIEFVDGGERLAFSTQVLGRSQEVVPVVTLALPGPGGIHRYQQRDFVRLDTNLPLSYAVLPAGKPEAKGEQGEEPEKVYHRGRTLDISGSGAQIVAHEAYPMGTKLELLLQLSGATLTLQAQVVRLAQQAGPREFWLGVRFVQLDERDRERIVRFIFSEQRFRRQKGLL
ncbi:MAG: flagellar brake protein [Bacillota bacterium]